MAEYLEVVPDKAHNLEYSGASPFSATKFLRRLMAGHLTLTETIVVQLNSEKPKIKMLHNIMTDKVEEFIKRRFKKDCDWVNGNCLWFALILQKRFPGGEIYYLPILGHFLYNIGENFYDWNGRYNISNEERISLNSLKYSDKIWYNRLIEDCFD